MIVMVVAFLLLNDLIVSDLFLLIRTLFFKSILRSNFKRNSALRIGNFMFAIVNSCLYFLVVLRFMFRLRFAERVDVSAVRANEWDGVKFPVKAIPVSCRDN